MAGDFSAEVHRQVEQLMGMPISLALRGRHAADDQGLSAWQQALEILREVDRVFSTYREDSYISRLGRGEIALAGCPPEVAEVLDLGERARQESDGAFDVNRPGPDGTTVLDPSGVVKGWAVDRAARALDVLVDTDYCLSAGGDMVCRTRQSGAPAWQIGVENPLDPMKVVAVVPVANGAVATSGLAHRGEHIVDARSGVTPVEVASVTVVAPTLTWADIDATAAFAMGARSVQWLESRPGRRGLVVWSDGTPRVFDALDVSPAAHTKFSWVPLSTA